jgi:hypothetical protein
MSKSGPKAPRGDYEVGYRRPPEGTRFKKGQSGNPKGRPRKVENLATVLHQVLAERVRVREGDAVRTVSKWEAMIQTLSNKAMKGDTRAFNAVSTLAQKAGQLETAEQPRMHPVLIVPGISSVEDWTREAAKHQAKYAGNVGDDESET